MYVRITHFDVFIAFNFLFHKHFNANDVHRMWVDNSSCMQSQYKHAESIAATSIVALFNLNGISI